MFLAAHAYSSSTIWQYTVHVGGSAFVSFGWMYEKNAENAPHPCSLYVREKDLMGIVLKRRLLSFPLDQVKSKSKEARGGIDSLHPPPTSLLYSSSSLLIPSSFPSTLLPTRFSSLQLLLTP